MNTGEWMTTNKINKWLLKNSPYPYVQADRDDEATIRGIRQAEEAAELEASKAAVVNFYRDENSGEILTICQECFISDESFSDLTYIGKAGDWDMCGVCDAQNVPGWYHGDNANNPNRK